MNRNNTCITERLRRWLTVPATCLFEMAFLVVAPNPASAAVITLDAVERGFITQSGATNPTNLSPGSRDYLLGNCSFASCPTSGGGEYRDFFGFAIPLIDGVVSSVELEIDTEGVDLTQSPSLTALFTSLDTTTSFAALGAGTVYGSTSYGSADAHTTFAIEFDQSAINAILADQGGIFLTGGRDTSAAGFSPTLPNHLVYEHSGPGDATRLIINTMQVPEPGTDALLCVAVLGLLTIRLARRRGSLC
jgi:hypothetical protein